MTRWLLSRPAPPARPAAKPTLTQLDDRAVPAAFTVLNTNDSGVDSFRAALAGVNASGDATNTASFLPGLTGTISLASDLPAVAKPVDIQGPGAAALTISGQSLYKIFRIDDGTAAAIDEPVSQPS